jgi:hypothetical protein
VFISAQVWAEEQAGGTDAAVKPPSPTSTVQAMLKGMTKARSYRVSVDIEGGFATQADHEITQRTVKEAYSGDVNGTLMKCSDPKAYRTAAKGVSFVDGGWRAILSDPAGVKLDRLFKFPETILQRALKHARNGTWLAPAGDDEAEADEDEADEDEEDAETSPGARGKTVVVKKKGKKGSAAKPARLPRILRIEASPEEALSHIIEVQNSNCFGGG